MPPGAAHLVREKESFPGSVSFFGRGYVMTLLSGILRKSGVLVNRIRVTRIRNVNVIIFQIHENEVSTMHSLFDHEVLAGPGGYRHDRQLPT